VPGADEVDAGVAAAACALEVEGKAAESALDDVFVVGAYIGRRGRGEAAAGRMGEEGGQVMVEGV
jgi:hypothetical protein